MAKFLLVWEMGANYGHTAALLPLANKPRADLASRQPTGDDSECTCRKPSNQELRDRQRAVACDDRTTLSFASIPELSFTGTTRRVIKKGKKTP